MRAACARSITSVSRHDAAISGAPPPPGSRTFGCVVVADHRAVEVAEAVDLGGAQEADVDPAALQPVAEDLGDRDDRVGGLGQLAVADRERQVARAWRRSCRSRRSARSSGACVARARLAARLGRPMPTKQTVPSRRRRAAATAIISSAV